MTKSLIGHFMDDKIINRTFYDGTNSKTCNRRKKFF